MGRTYLEHLSPDYLRYYFASKFGSRVTDLDLNFDEFVSKVNSDLVGKVVNIASRSAGFITKRFDGQLGQVTEHAKLKEFIEAGKEILWPIICAR